ncbi:MAG: fibronectin type III domain-containing protein [bacterium]|nr:fibronectin type III domain-containing protein [bacterium]
MLRDFACAVRPRRRRPAASVRLGLAAAVLLVVVAGGPGGCERAPQPPVWNNPFDPAGPWGGDPLELVAIAGAGDITLTWRQPQGLGIVSYAISRADDGDGPWSSLDLVDHTAEQHNFYVFDGPDGEDLQPTDLEPTREYWFRIQALDARDNASLVDYATPARVDLGPRVLLNDGAATLASRFVTMKVVVSHGTTLRVALGPDYATESTYPAAAAGDTAVIALEAPRAAQGDSVGVRVIATDGAFTSAPTRTKTRIDFSPDFGLLGGGTLAASRTVSLAIPATGVVQMRFVKSLADTQNAPWVPGAATHAQELLGTGVEAQDIWGQFDGDFGIRHTARITVTPDLLTAASFRLLLPTDHFTATSAIRGVLTGEATQVRWSESPDLASAPWVAYQDTLDIVLSPEFERKTVYVQMRNDWRSSPVLSDYVVLGRTAR